MFSTLITRRPVYSRVSLSLLPCPAARVSWVLPPITPSTSKRLPLPSMGTAASFTREPPSSKLDW